MNEAKTGVEQRIGRRAFLKGSALAGFGAFLAACAGTSSQAPSAPASINVPTPPPASPSPSVAASATPKPAPTGPLKWAQWPAYIDLVGKAADLLKYLPGSSPTLEAFKKQYNVDVDYEEKIQANETFLATIRPQLVAGAPTGWDMVTVTDWLAAKLISKGWIEKIDQSNVPNCVANLREPLKNQVWDPNQDYHYPWQSGMTGIGYNKATLAPFVWAAPTPEIEVFLSTQMVDEARHTVFFEKWWREVCGTSAKDMTELLVEIRPEANEGYNTLFYDRLPSAAQRLASNPKDFDAFVEGVTLYHIVIEATIALTGQRFELEAMREQGLTDRGFYQGFTAVARDESRHVNFGIKVLQEAVREDARRYAPLIQKTLMECLPLISGTLDPPDPRYVTDYGHTESEIVQFAIDSLNKRLRAIGINLAA